MERAKELIGENIKKWREFKSVKQEALASRLGISKAALSHMENGKTDITISRIEQIANILQIDLEQLLATSQQLMNVNKSSASIVSDKVNNTQHFLISIEVVKMLREELQLKNKQLEQLMQVLNKCMANNFFYCIVLLSSQVADI